MGIALTVMVGCMCAPIRRSPSWHAVRKHRAPPSALCATIPMVLMADSESLVRRSVAFAKHPPVSTLQQSTRPVRQRRTLTLRLGPGGTYHAPVFAFSRSPRTDHFDVPQEDLERPGTIGLRVAFAPAARFAPGRGLRRCASALAGLGESRWNANRRAWAIRIPSPTEFRKHVPTAARSRCAEVRAFEPPCGSVVNPHGVVGPGIAGVRILSAGAPRPLRMFRKLECTTPLRNDQATERPSHGTTKPRKGPATEKPSDGTTQLKDDPAER